MTYNVINIDDARELRELGLPILPIVDKEFSHRAMKLFAKAEQARIKFYRTFVDYCKTAEPTERGYNRIRKALDKVLSVRNQAATYTSADDSEAQALQSLLTEPMTSFLAFWAETLERFEEEGQAVTVHVTREMFDGWSVGETATP